MLFLFKGEGWSNRGRDRQIIHGFGGSLAFTLAGDMHKISVNVRLTDLLYHKRRLQEQNFNKEHCSLSYFEVFNLQRRLLAPIVQLLPIAHIAHIAQFA